MPSGKVPDEKLLTNTPYEEAVAYTAAIKEFVDCWNEYVAARKRENHTFRYGAAPPTMDEAEETRYTLMQAHNNLSRASRELDRTWKTLRGKRAALNKSKALRFP